MCEFTLTPYVDIVDPTTNDDGNKIQFKFSELSKEIQDKLVRKRCESYSPDYEWWDCVYEDAVACAECMGIDIYTSDNRGKEIHFSGFYSQGDGASFTGCFNVREMKDAVKKTKVHASLDTDLHAMAEEAERIYNEILRAVTTSRLTGEAESDNSDQWLTDRFQIKNNSFRSYVTRVYNYDGPPDLEEDFNQLAEDFASWIYKGLQAEYEHLTSEEMAREYLIDNDTLYDETGEEV